MKRFVIVVSLLLMALRLLLVAGALASGTVSGVLLGISGLVVCITTAAAWLRGRPDWSVGGIVVGLSYLAVLSLRCDVDQVAAWLPVFWLVFALQCWVRWWLWTSCTVTGPVFVAVVDRGPYRWIRHPMNLVDFLLAGVVALQFPCWHNALAVAIVAAAKFGTIATEEKFLLQYQVYREYSSAVRWRVFPGVW